MQEQIGKFYTISTKLCHYTRLECWYNFCQFPYSKWWWKIDGMILVSELFGDSLLAALPFIVNIGMVISLITHIALGIFKIVQISM